MPLLLSIFEEFNMHELSFGKGTLYNPFMVGKVLCEFAEDSNE